MIWWLKFASEFSGRVRIRIRIRSCIAATAVHSDWHRDAFAESIGVNSRWSTPPPLFSIEGRGIHGYTVKQADYDHFMSSKVKPLVAFHPRPQIASDLGRNVTRSFNPHRNRKKFPSGNEILAYGRRFKSQPASTRCDLRIASPTRPFLQVI